MSLGIRAKKKPKDSTIGLYTYSDLPSSIIGFKLLNDGSFDELDLNDDATEISENLYGTSITTPEEDCMVCCIYRGQPVCFAVGLPDKKFVYYSAEEGQTIEYSNITTSGDSISDGTLVEAGSGFYYLNMDMDYEESFMIIDGFKFKVDHNIGDEVVANHSIGSIKIQNNVWQLISIPRKGVNVKEYFVDRLAAKYDANPEDMVEVCNAFFGDENKFRSYIPGVTKSTTANNFPLVHDDSSSMEITGFWVKTKDLSGVVSDIDDVTIEWEGNL